MLQGILDASEVPYRCDRPPQAAPLPLSIHPSFAAPPHPATLNNAVLACCPRPRRLSLSPSEASTAAR